jgi:uncharacterized protein YvpB
MQRPGRFAAACWAVILVLAQAVAGTALAAGDVTVGREATVEAPGGLNVRNDPSPMADVLTLADDGDFVYVLAGPKRDGEETWYAIEYDGFVGWVAGQFLSPARERTVVATRGDRPTGSVAAAAAWLPVPYYSQFDGTAYSRANCGPASLVMALGAFGRDMPITDIRRAANRMQGTTGWYDAGVAIEVLADLAGRYGMSVHWSGTHDRWSFDEVREALRRGHLVIPQVHLATLPGQERSSRAVDHYIVITGFDGGRFYYNDPAFSGAAGHGLAISEERLALAWKRSDFPFAAFAVGPGQGMSPLVEPARSAEPRQSASAIAAVRDGLAGAATAAPSHSDALAAAAAVAAARLGEDAPARAEALVVRPPPDWRAFDASVDPSIDAADPRSESAASHEGERAFVPVWSGAVTHGDVEVAIGRVSLSTGASPAQLWTMVAGALGLAAFGARRQFARLPLRAPVALRRPTFRLAFLRQQ